MMRIAQCKIDSKGRITIPKSFLKANCINSGSTVSVENVYASRSDNINQVKLIFHNEYEKNPSK